LCGSPLPIGILILRCVSEGRNPVNVLLAGEERRPDSFSYYGVFSFFVFWWWGVFGQGTPAFGGAKSLALLPP
ncbi:MAG: hypothetical protein AAF199_04770, partial [Pseudomonadota bacterium]